MQITTHYGAVMSNLRSVCLSILFNRQIDLNQTWKGYFLASWKPAVLALSQNTPLSTSYKNHNFYSFNSHGFDFFLCLPTFFCELPLKLQVIKGLFLQAALCLWNIGSKSIMHTVADARHHLVFHAPGKVRMCLVQQYLRFTIMGLEGTSSHAWDAKDVKKKLIFKQFTGSSLPTELPNVLYREQLRALCQLVCTQVVKPSGQGVLRTSEYSCTNAVQRKHFQLGDF